MILLATYEPAADKAALSPERGSAARPAADKLDLSAVSTSALRAELRRRPKPARQEKETGEIVRFLAGQLRRLSARMAAEDPDGLKELRLLAEELESAIAIAVAGYRRSGFSDADIGRELGVSKQAVQQRWPR